MPPMNFQSSLNALYFNPVFPAIPLIPEPVIDNFIGPPNPTFDGNTGSPFSSSTVRTYTKSFKVGIRIKEYANPVTVCKCPGLPIPYAPYVSNDGLLVDPAAFAVSIHAEPMEKDDWQWWIVTVEYTTEMPENGPNFFVQWPTDLLGPQNNPWDERPTLKMEKETYQAAEPFDLEGKPYVNSAGTPLSPAPTRQVTIPVYVFKRNMSTTKLTPQLIADYNDVLNEHTFLGQPKGTVHCTLIPGDLKYRGRICYYDVTIRFRVKTRMIKDPEWVPGNGVQQLVREQWQPYYLDQGTEEILDIPFLGGAAHPLNGRPVPITEFGQPVTTPRLLDKNGKVQRPINGVLYPRWLKFTDYKYKDLNNLFTN